MPDENPTPEAVYRYASHREKWRYWVHALIDAPEDLRPLLKVDEANYRFVAGSAHTASRDYYLYAALDEIEKLGVAILGWDEIIGEEKSSTKDTNALSEIDPRVRAILERSLDEQSFWVRKALELLIDLVCFSETNENAYYRHLLLLQELREHVSNQQDLTTFYGAPSNNVDWSIRRAFEKTREIEEAEVDFGRVWYARDPLKSVPKTPGGILTSVRHRLRTALPPMHPHEKLTVGLSYARAYGTVSADIHFRPHATLRDVSTDAIASGIDRVAISWIAAIERIQELLGEVPAGINEQLRNAHEGNEYPAKILDLRTRNRADVGDFVLAHGDLGEVLEKREGVFGYETYRVQYLAERPLPGIDDDWFLAEEVERFYTSAEFLIRMRETVSACDALAYSLERIDALPPERRQEIIRESLVHVWEDGLRDWIRNKKRQAAKSQHPFAPPFKSTKDQ